MKNDIEKKLKTAKLLKCVMLGSLVLTLLFLTLGAMSNIDSLLACGVAFLVIALLTPIIYNEVFHPLCKSVKYLYKFGLQDVLNDIKTTEFNLPISKIYMGSRAFYAKHPATIIPYSMVVWAYLQQTKYMGVVPMDEKVIVRCRDGSSFEIRANRNELQTLLQGVYQFSPDLIVGYGRNQIEQYSLIVKNCSKQK